MKDWPWYYFVLIAVLIFAVFYMGMYKPRNGRITDLQNQRLQEEREVSQLKKKKTQLDKIEKELETMTLTLNTLETVVPKEKEISDIFRTTQQLAYDNNLEIRNFTPKGEVQRDFYSDWPIDIDLNGGYHNLGRFFASLSNFERLFTVEKFSIRALQRQSDETTISVSCTAKTYILRETAEENSPAQKKGKRQAQR
jgi:type IV pilus assembly protein PilO